MSKNLLLAVFVLLGAKAFACHGLAVMSPSVTTNATDIVINANSDAASCGCGPYWLQVEVSYSTSFTLSPPSSASPAWGNFPWYHSLLNVPNYNSANGWPDNCVVEPYTTINIPFSQLCAGSTVYIRMREWVEGSNSAGAWTSAATVTIPGPAPVLSGSAYSGRSLICANDTTFLNVLHNGCSGNYTASWAPSASVLLPNAITTVAQPSVTTTYTVTFTDVALAQTFTATVTVNVSPPLNISLSSTIASCNQSDANVTSTVTGGSGSYTYLWSNTATTANLTGVSSGMYTVLVTDSIGCSDSMFVLVTDSCDYVWPGDANDDAVADINDILAIGIANGATGTTRPSATITWIGQPSANWGPTFLNGSDYKFGDCNGDGTIDANDTTAVILNWGMTHNNRQGNEATTFDPAISGDCIPDTVGSSSAGILRVSLGDNTTPATVYGISFRLSYDEQYIDPASIGVYSGNSWIGASANRMTVRVVSSGYGFTDIAITRMDQTDTTGFGTLLDVYFMTTDTIAGSGQTVNVPMTISNVNLINSAEQTTSVNIMNDTLVITDGFALTVPSQNPGQIGVYPNPAASIITVALPNAHADRITLTDVMGRELSVTTNVSSNQHEINLEGLSAGIYFVTVFENGVQSTVKVVKE